MRTVVAAYVDRERGVLAVGRMARWAVCALAFGLGAACSGPADEGAEVSADAAAASPADATGGSDPTDDPSAAESPLFRAVSEAMFGAVAGMVGRTVVVSILDEDAQPVSGARVTADLESGRSIVARAIGPGQFQLDGLLGEDVDIRAELAGAALRIRHPTDARKATLVFPVGGEVLVYWVLPERKRIEKGQLRLVVSGRGDSRVRIEQNVDGSVPASYVELPYLRPGEYEVALELWEVPLGAPNRRVVIPVTAPRVVRVRPGEASRVRLGVPSEGSGGVALADPGAVGQRLLE